MKATILQGDLNKWLNVVGRVVPNRGQLPVLSNVLIEAGKEGVVLSATNLEIGLRVVAGGKVLKEGAITVPAKNFSEFVGSLPAGNVELESEGEKLKVGGGKLNATFAGIAAAEFPVISKPDETEGKKKGFAMKKNTLEEVATQVAYAAAGDESRPVLTGVMFEISGKKLKVTATDGFRLSRKTITTEAEIKGLEKGLILPARTIMEISRVVAEGKKEDVEVEIAGDSNQVIMGYEGIYLASRVLEGNFPDVEKIIPADGKTEIAVDKEDLVRAVKAVGIFARDSANVIKFKIEGETLVVEASSSQTGESRVEVEMEKKGEDGQIAFNYRYVQDFLNSVGGERVTFKMNDSLAPGVFGLEKDDSLIHLIMPVRV
jgi:DNA polymerase III subunit beta